jgi:streptomycin 6-kinase
MFEPYVERWNLEPDGPPIVTQLSMLLPVRRRGKPAMLKLLMHEEERRGSDVLAWWAGQSAVRVLAREGDGVLLERAMGERSLDVMARNGQDDEAVRIICDVALALHEARNGEPPAGLPTLGAWFAPLWPVAQERGGVLALSAEAGRDLLDNPEGSHGNVLDGGARAWLAIDPKGLIGDPGFDFANIFRDPEHLFGPARTRIARRAAVIAGATGIPEARLLGWALAFCGLSAAWALGDEHATAHDLEVAEMDLAIAEGVAEVLG